MVVSAEMDPFERVIIAKCCHLPATNLDKSGADALECKMATNLLFSPPKTLLSRSYSRPKSTRSSDFTTSPTKSYSDRTWMGLEWDGERGVPKKMQSEMNLAPYSISGIRYGLVSLGASTIRYRAPNGSNADIFHFYHFHPF